MAIPLRAISPAPLVARRGPPARRLGALLGRAAATISEWRARARQRQQLAELLASRDHRLLRDLRIDRFSAQQEIDKPFWRP